MGISVVICTKNEEQNIRRCLLSVQDIADEIIIVDSKSTDKTAEICREFPNLKFYTSDWMGFSKTKNYANSLASNDYILSLDADEELTAECQRHILNLKSNLQDVYTINRLTNYCGTWIRHSGWFPDRHVRLFPKKSSIWSGEIHEVLKYDSSLRVLNLDGVVHHFTYYTIEEHWNRINTYTTLSAQKYLRKTPTSLIVAMVFNPPARLFRHFVLKRGFLDGFYGLVIAVLSSVAVFLKYAKAYHLKRKKDS